MYVHLIRINIYVASKIGIKETFGKTDNILINKNSIQLRKTSNFKNSGEIPSILSENRKYHFGNL